MDLERSHLGDGLYRVTRPDGERLEVGDRVGQAEDLQIVPLSRGGQAAGTVVAVVGGEAYACLDLFSPVATERIDAGDAIAMASAGWSVSRRRPGDEGPYYGVAVHRIEEGETASYATDGRLYKKR